MTASTTSFWKIYFEPFDSETLLTATGDLFGRIYAAGAAGWAEDNAKVQSCFALETRDQYGTLH